jgi:hypothetical protein
MQPIATTAALKVSSSCTSSQPRRRRSNACGSVGPSAPSIRSSRPPAATSSSERTMSVSGPKRRPLPCVEVEMTPATVCAS